MKKNLLIIIAICITGVLLAQPLKRRASLGIYGHEISDTLKKKYGISQGVIVDSLRKNNTSEFHQLLTNDIIISMNGDPVNSIRELSLVVSKYREGEKVDFGVIRKNNRIKVEGTFPAFPFEKSETHEIIYDDFSFDNGLLRTIIDKPQGDKKFPAILFIQGYTCSSIDNMGNNHPYIRLCKELCEKGYVVMRMEKPGIGDCSNETKCADLDFHTEKNAFLKALQELKKYDFVDTSNVFIWGHSLGGIIAPIIANEEHVKGVIVYGTTIKPWREYLIEMFRFQYPLLGVDYVENEENISILYQIIHKLYIDKQTPAEIAKDSVLAEYLRGSFLYDGKDRILTRNYKAYVQIDDYNMAEQWRDAATNSLVFWGSADLEAFSKFDHETIVDVVNHYHPGKGTFIHLKNTTHSFAKVESMQHGIENRNWKYITENFNEEIVKLTDQWMQKTMKQ